MNQTKKLFVLILSAAMIFSLAACGSSSEAEDETTEDVIQTSFTFEIEDGPEVVIDVDPDSGYVMTVNSSEADEDDNEGAEENSGETSADFTITSSSETINGCFKTVTMLTEIELYYYPGYEEIEIGDFSGFLVQANEDEYDLLLELDDNNNYICLYADDEETDLVSCAEALTLTVTVNEE